ncbi:hypothetical protein EJ08DRAFT_111815 [Tothia fuscella]|uniref:Uncharacterized protein n=1 Tax=Tothia fuscella TaxID=1048955 RepID=A0A9P4U1A6_9PEZI|nr:hypothetical protein EJ08DRAFT_111815 [Tothia fuscella]
MWLFTFCQSATCLRLRRNNLPQPPFHAQHTYQSHSNESIPAAIPTDQAAQCPTKGPNPATVRARADSAFADEKAQAEAAKLVKPAPPPLPIFNRFKSQSLVAATSTTTKSNHSTATPLPKMPFLLSSQTCSHRANGSSRSRSKSLTAPPTIPSRVRSSTLPSNHSTSNRHADSFHTNKQPLGAALRSANATHTCSTSVRSVSGSNPAQDDARRWPRRGGLALNPASEFYESERNSVMR